ncbi:MAG: hypothetical protein PGN25_10550 [Methylorubrum populi]
MQVQASREDRVKAVTAAISRLDASNRQVPGIGRLPHDVARALAEQVVDAVIAADDRETRLRR